MSLWTVDSTSVHTDSTIATVDGFSGASAAALAGAATDTTSATGALTNYSSVVLTAPLYTGIGGILDPNFWLDAKPVVGNTIFFDPAITVLPNGEINSASNTVSAVVQFNNGSGWAFGLVTFTPFMVGYATDTSSASGALNAGAVLAAAATSLTSAVGALTTGINLSGAAADLTTAVGALSTAIQLAAAASDASSASGTLVPGGASLAGAASDTTSANADLSTQIALAGAAADVVTATGALTTQILLAAQAADATSATGSLTTGILLAGASTDSTSALGLLGSIQLLLAVANDVTVAAGSLITQIVLSASATSSTLAAGDLSTAIQLAGSAQDTVSASGSLGVLSLKIRPSRLITTTFYSNNLLGSAGPLPYAEYFSRVGDVEIYAIDWDGWLSNFWERGEIVSPGQVIRPTSPNGFQFKTTLGGQAGNSEPVWPNIIGQTVTDGSVVWTAQAIDTTSLFATVVSVAWQVPPGITVTAQSTLGQLVIAEIDASAATAGTNYPINVSTKMSDGETKVGQIVLKVR
jgi:hypothetical protein